MKSIDVHIIHRAVLLCILHYCLLQFCFSQCWVYEKKGTNNYLRSVCFVDSLTGTAVGDGGVIVNTTDGGITWIKLASGTSANLSGVSFLDKNIGMVGASPNGILYTSDGGISWTMKSISYNHSNLNIVDIAMLDSSRAVVATSGGLFKTIDRGITWAHVLNISNPTAISFANASFGTAVGYPDSIYRTTDGGLTWAAVFTPDYYTDISTPDSNTIIAVTQQIILRSGDGGKTWSQEQFQYSGYVNFVSFVNSLRGVMISQDRESFLTNDGGLNWTEMKKPNTYNPVYSFLWYSAVTCVGSNSFCAVGEFGTIITMVNDCSREFVPISPPDGASHQLLSQISPGQFSVSLQWDYPAYVAIAAFRVEAGTDSVFGAGLIRDTTVVQGFPMRSTTFTLLNVVPKQTYFWRVKAIFTDSTSTAWSDTWKFTTGSALISGSLFGDDNADSIREVGETGLVNWQLDISGKIQEAVYTDSNGNYSVGGLDSGTYIITQHPPQQEQEEWRRTFPSFASYALTIGVNDTIRGIDFGDTYPWNSIEGTVYLDVNENGTRDAFEPAMTNWTITLFGQNSVLIIHTDSLGHYRFPHVDPGTNTIQLTIQPPYEQETPPFQQGYTDDIQTYGDHYTGFDFSVHKIPIRVKIPLTVYDNTLVNRRDIWFGIRPGATYGIWGVDPKATNVDFSESEFEIPPPTFGLFDARFQDPHGGIAQFGAGSWTDMRDFFSTTQRDTFLFSIAPGYYFNGNYPMTIQWSRKDIHSAFPTVDPILIDPKGNRIDMWGGTGDTLHVTVSDSTISSMFIVTEAPNITFNRRWNMVSLPQNIFDDYVHNLFTTANSHAFGYLAGLGYTIQDTLHTGKGYWVNYSTVVDSLKTNPGARLLDSIAIQPGWNMIGTLSSPVAINSIITIPPGIFSSRFFGYDRGYSVTDTLLPTKGYWIKVTQAGKMFLNASGTVTVPKIVTQNSTSTLSFQDNAGNREQLYCRTIQTGDTNDLYEAPPLPPEGEFDVRFSSNRILETIGEKQTGKFPIVIQGAEFPMTVSWQGKANSIKASIFIDGKETFLNGKATLRIENPSSTVLLKVSGMPAVPSAFALQQNYPNPFNPSTTIRYNVPVTSHVTVTIYNTLGQIVATLVDGMQDAGYQTIEWNAGNFASGVYYYRMQATSNTHDVFSQVRKMVLIR